MKCPYCGGQDSDVVETRDCDDFTTTRRRRECRQCKKRFTTYERVENIELVVIKKDGRRESFDREKLRLGLIKACEKRPISRDLIESVICDIEQELRQRDSVEVSSKAIGNMMLKKLKKIDKVAYLRFASVYLDFDDLADFEQMIEKIG
jgi:transcriptional repressor NrdR